MTPCDHCGTDFAPRHEDDHYCCRGCEFVAATIREGGFEHFYELKRDRATTPVKSRPFEQHDLSWLPAGETDTGILDCAVEGVSCVGCVWLIDRLFREQPGAIRASVRPAAGRVRLEWQPGACDLTAFARELIRFGYVLAPATDDAADRIDRGLVGRLGLCGAFALNAMGFSLPGYLGMPDDFEFAGLFELIVFASASFAMLVGGSFFITRAWRALRLGTLHIDLPIALGLIAAYLGSLAGWALGLPSLIYFDFVATFVFLMLGGRWLQTMAVDRNRRRMARRSPVPRTLRIRENDVALEKVTVGDEFDLTSGHALPISANLVSGDAEVSLEWIHGEPDPVPVRAGATLPAGAVLLGRRPVTLRARETWADSLLSRLTAEAPPERESPLLRRVLAIYLVAIILLGLAGFGWWAWHGRIDQALQVMISVFVVSCPCALGIALPLADERANRFAARAGAFIRHAGMWSRLRQVRQIVFDKTGTLTLSQPVLENPDALETLDDEAAAALARLTTGSCHPVSRSLLEALGARGQHDFSLAEPEETPGGGVTLDLHGAIWSLGRAGWIADGPPGTTVLARDGETLAAFRFRDGVRPGAREVVADLHRRGFRVHLLSGDQPEKVAAFARSLDLDPALVHGGLSPDDKARLLGGIDRRDTLFLGDGANDSLAFDRAWVTGTPVADHSLLERKADFFTLGNGLHWLPVLFAAARARALGIRRAFTFALAYNLAAVSLCFAGLMNPLLAAILMPLSSVVSLALVTSTGLAAGTNPGQHAGDEDPPTCETPTPFPSASTSAC